jgi:8-oxo-dGTP pyrophosphatase MutT (NUDIX family)
LNVVVTRAASPGDVPVLDASTVMLLRDRGPVGSSVLEVCLMQRNLDSDFVGGAYVFPGGAVDPDDADPAAFAACAGLTDAEASRRLGLDSGGLAFWVAVIREAFEEAGVLMANQLSGLPLDLADPQVADRFATHRSAVDGSHMSIAQVAAAEDLRLDVGSIHYFSRWITPLGSHRRYDTRFFVAASPVGQEVVADDRELIGTRWMTPAEALAAHDSGDIVLIFPTVRTLVALDRFRCAADVLDHARRISQIQPILPTIADQSDGVRIVLPGDPEGTGGIYDAWTARPLDPDRA